MIEVIMTRKRDIYTLKMDGHASYDTENDVVCAAASAIAFSFMGFLENSNDVKYAEEMCHTGENGGKMSIVVRCGKRVFPAFEMTYIGLAQIAKKYPQKICIKKFLIC